VKYTFTGTVSTTLQLIFDDAGTNKLKVTIKDTGRGITDLSKIGEWFANLDIVENVN